MTIAELHFAIFIAIKRPVTTGRNWPLAVNQWWSLNDSFLLSAYAAFGRYFCDWGQFGAHIPFAIKVSPRK